MDDLATGVLMHLVLDAMWSDPTTLWWPFLGWEFTSTGFTTFVDYTLSVLSNPWMWVGEAVGVLYLGKLWRSSRLGDRANRATLLSTGRVSAPIGRD